MPLALNRWRQLGLLVAALLVAALTAHLGFWQLDRAAQKEQLQLSLQTQSALPPLALDALPRTRADGNAPAQRRAVLQGQWLNDRSIYLDNRPMKARTGFYLVTPLLLADGSAVLVQRGWLPRDAADRSRVAPPPATPGTVTVQGRIAPALARLYEFDAAASGPIRQNLAIDVYAQETKLRLRPWALVQDDSGAAGFNATPTATSDGLLRQWPTPDAGLQKHYGYAFQWFALSALSLFLYVWFQLIRPRRHAARRQSP